MTYVFEIVVPGTWLAGIPDSEARQVDALLRLMQSSLTDAALALSMFEDAMRTSSVFSDHEKEWDADRAREEQVRAELENTAPSLVAPAAQFEAMRRWEDQVRFEANRRAWNEGRLPRSYRMRPPFIHAKSCLYALDTISKSLALLSSHVDDVSELDALLDVWNDSMPDLINVRNSAHHPEDRVRGLSHKNAIYPQPVENGMIRAPEGGVLVVDSLNNNRYGGTLSDGRFGEIEISPATVSVAAHVVQAAHNLFSWTGPQTQVPS